MESCLAMRQTMRIVILGLLVAIGWAVSSCRSLLGHRVCYEGIVIDDEGNPIPNAKVELWYQPYPLIPGWGARIPVVIAATNSDTMGQFVLESYGRGSYFNVLKELDRTRFLAWSGSCTAEPGRWHVIRVKLRYHSFD
jgi:hypothetical protein